MNHFSTKRDDRDQFSETGQNMSRSWLVLHVRGKKSFREKHYKLLTEEKIFLQFYFYFFFPSLKIFQRYKHFRSGL